MVIAVSFRDARWIFVPAYVPSLSRFDEPFFFFFHCLNETMEWNKIFLSVHLACLR